MTETSYLLLKSNQCPLFTIRKAFQKKSRKAADTFRTSLSLLPPGAASTDTYGDLFLKLRTRDSRHLAKKRADYHSWGNLSFSVEIHKFWC